MTLFGVTDVLYSGVDSKQCRRIARGELLKRGIMAVLTILAANIAYSQQYSGMSGLLQVPSAEMDTVGQVRIGGHFLNKHSTPDVGFKYEGEKYNTGCFYLSITPFKWVEIGYTMNMLKLTSRADGHRYWGKDRYFSVKFQPLAERDGKWWPSVAIGAQDALASTFDNLINQGGYFRNYYIAATKNILWKNQIFGATLAYRRYTKKSNSHWNGVVGGITYRPGFAPNFRGVLEYAGGGQVNFGINCVLWKHLMLQASLERFKYFNAGVCYTMNLF